MRILLIEDDETVAELEQKLLKGHEVVHVTNLHDAIDARVDLNWKQKAEFDIVVLDLKLPVPRRPGEFHNFEEVIERAREVFKDSIVIVVSGYLDLDTMAFADEHNIICLDKSLLTETKDFIETFNKAVEVSKMRTGLLQHMTTDAVIVASGNIPPGAAGCPTNRPTMRDQAEAIVFLGAGLTFIFLPWLCVSSYIYAVLIAKVADFALPMYKEILAVCFVCLAALVGVSLPYLLKLFRGDVK